MDAAVLALLASGAASTAGSVYNTQKQLELAAQNNDTSIELSNTAHQREVVDLIKAGINPVLTASGSGASVPTMQTAKTENALSGLADGISSASQFLSKQYRQGLEQQAIVTDGERLANKSQQINNSAARTELQILRAQKDARLSEAKAQALEADVRSKEAYIDSIAVDRALGVEYDSDGMRIMNKREYDSFMDSKRDAIRAAAKDASNRNWRNNLNTIMNSANTVGRIISGSRGK